MRELRLMLLRSDWSVVALLLLAAVTLLVILSGCAKPEPIQDPAPAASATAEPAAAPAPAEAPAAVGAAVGTRPMAPVAMQANPMALTPEQRLSLKRAYEQQAAQQITPQNAEAAAESLAREIEADLAE